MKNNNGFGKFEGLTILVLILGVTAFFMYTILGGVSEKKLQKFRTNIVPFNKAVYTNIDSFKNPNIVYLDEVIDLGFIKKIKSPFSSGMCDSAESKVETLKLSDRYVTLKCDQFLIYKEKANNSNNVKIYEVSEWSLEKPEGEIVDEEVLYNCQKSDGTLVFPNYREEYYFLYAYNKLYSNSYYNVGDIKGSCTVVSNTFYRTRKEYKGK